jgi:hypothetical protein
VGFSRYQQNPKSFANAVDLDDGAVVHRRYFPGQRRGFKLEDVGARVIDLQAYFLGPPDRYGDNAVLLAVLDNCDLRGVAIAPTVMISHQDFDFDGFTDKAKARLILDDQPPVSFFRGTGQKRMYRSRNQGLDTFARGIVYLTVGDQECTADPVFRDACECPLNVFEQTGPIHWSRPVFVRFSGANDANINVAHALKIFGQGGDCFFRLTCALTYFLRRGFVDHDGNDILVENAFPFDEYRVRHRCQQDRCGQEAQACTPRPSPESEPGEGNCNGGQYGENRP